MGAEASQIADLRADGWEWSDIADRVGGSVQARRIQLARAVRRVAKSLHLNGTPMGRTRRDRASRRRPPARGDARRPVGPPLARGGRPDLDEFLAGEGDLAPAQLAAVVGVDQRERWAAGDRPSAECYLARSPVVAEDPDLALDLVYGEFLLREEAGESPTIGEYLARFPELADGLELQVEFHRALQPAEASPIPPGAPRPGGPRPAAREPRPAGRRTCPPSRATSSRASWGPAGWGSSTGPSTSDSSGRSP